MYCPNCGQEIINESNFCSKCGLPVNLDSSSSTKVEFQKNIFSQTNSDGKIAVSYVISIIETIIVLFIRYSFQMEIKYNDSVFTLTKNIGLDNFAILLLTIIPVVTLLSFSLLIILDKTNNIQKKFTAFIINLFLVLLSITCIWFNISL